MIDDYAQKAIFDLDDYSQIRQRVVPKVYARLKKRPIAASRLLMIMNSIESAKREMESLERILTEKVEE